MKNSSLVKYISTLTNTEIKEFRLWLASPLHNSRLELILLFDYILAFRNDNNQTDLTKTAAFAATFPNEKYVDKQLRYAMSFLLQELKAYLIWQQSKEHEIQEKKFLLQQLRKRNLFKPFEQELKKAMQIIDNQKNRNSDYFYQKHQLYLEQYEYLQTQSRGKGMPIKEVSETFSIYAVANTLKWQCNIITHQSVSLTEYDEVFFQKILYEVKNGLHQSVPTVSIYYEIYQALTTGANKHYQNLKLIINNHFEIFSKNEKRDILLLSINYCIKKLNQGKGTYLAEIFDWYKKGFETNVFIKNGELSRFTYNNVAIAGLKLGEFEWTKAFLENNKQYISKNYQDDIYHFNLALWYQYQNQYDEVLDLLLQVSFKDVLHGLHAKQLIAKIYYEMNAFDALESLLGSIKVYLHRHKELGYHRQGYLKLIKYLKKLIQMNRNDKASKEKLLAQIKEESTLLDKAWFIRQLEK